MIERVTCLLVQSHFLINSFRAIDRIFQIVLCYKVAVAITHLLKEYRIHASKHRRKRSRNK